MIKDDEEVRLMYLENWLGVKKAMTLFNFKTDINYARRATLTEWRESVVMNPKNCLSFDSLAPGDSEIEAA
jgi:hypothetical protein